MALTNGDKDYLGAVLKPLVDDMKEVKHTLKGNPEVAGDNGIEGMVGNNTRFRLGITRSVKYLWGLIVLMLGKNAYDFWDRFKSFIGGN